MMQRPRLSRALYLTLLALAGLLAVSYFPLSSIRAAVTGATILPSAGKPLVNLKTPQTAKVTYTGAAIAVAALQSGTAAPTALASADFNADGAMDVVAGYSTKTGGVLALFHANPDAFAPTDLTLYGKAAQGKVPPTFLSKASAFTLPESPDLVATADFNGDGKKDVLVGARGSNNLYLLAGDGRGNLLPAQAVPVLGQLRAFAVTADGHVAVSTDGPNGPQLAILDPSSQGLASQGPSVRATYPLPTRGDSVAWGHLGGELDVAVGAGSNVVMIYSALTSSAQTEIVTLPFQVQGLVLGDFIWDRDGRTEISVLANDGSIHILQHGTLNTTPVTAAELPARRAALRGHHKPAAARPNPTALGAWTIAKQLAYTGSAPSGPVSASAFNSPRLANSSTPDLMVLDAAASQLHILDTSGKTASPSADILFSGVPVAALALPNKINSDRDIVVLTSSQPAPMLVTSPVTLTLNVNTTADIDSVNACTNSGVTSAPSTLSLREAVCIANNNAPATTTINVPSGTYDLTSLETGELRAQTGAAYNLTINGTGTAANTIIQQTDGVDRILEEDYALEGNNPMTIENVTLTGGNCTNTSTNDCDYGGGAVIAGAVAGDNVTVTNVVMSNNTTAATGGGDEEDGGGLNFAGPNLTITNSTFSGNYANGNGNFNDGVGGGVYFVDQDTSGCTGCANGFLTITNSSFTNNKTNGGGGGGLWAEMSTGDPLTITGSTFTGNTAGGGGSSGGYDGGGINASQSGLTATTVTVSNSRIVGNSATGSGNGVYVDEATAVLANSWWGCNAGPGNSGCDSVVIINGGGFTPVLTLSIGAASTEVVTGDTTTLTAKLSNSGTCSGYIGNACYVPDGTSATFSGGSLGSANPTSTTFTGGVATSTFTAGGTAGTDTTVSVTVDNQTEDVTINIGAPPMFTSSASTTFTVGTNGNFPVTASGSPTPTITQTGGSLPSGVQTSGGSGTLTLSGTPAGGTGGVYTVDFQAANGFLPNATQTFTLTVDQAPSITSGNSTTFTYETFGTFPVTTGAGTYPAATFSESGSLPNGVTLNTTTGVLSGTPTQTGSFPITITAANGVSPNATQSFMLTVGALTTSINVTGVTSSSEVYGVGSTVTITAVLSWTGSGTPPTASDVTIGGNGPSGYSATSCGAPSGDTLTCTATYTPTGADTVGTYTESASFSGDSNYTGSSSPQTNNFSITQASSFTSVMSSLNPSTVGQQVTFTATIDGQYGEVKGRNGALPGVSVSGIKRGMPQRSLTQKGQAHGPVAGGIGGTVTWSANTGCSPSTVSGDPGTAQCTTTTLPQGTDTITATYGGDTNHSGSVGTLSGGQVVNSAVTSTSINVTSVNAASEVYGQDAQITTTAVLSWTGNGPTPTASDVFIGGTGPNVYSATSCGGPVSNTLTCTATYTPTAADTVGTYTESAVFAGDGNYPASSSPQTNNFSITQASSSTSVMSSLNPSTVGQQVTFTATINGQYGDVKGRNGGLPGGVTVIKRGATQRRLTQKGQVHPPDIGGIGGSVTWSDNTGCGTTPVSGNPGTAQCITTTLPQGSDTITANYSGDSNHTGSMGTLSPNQLVNLASTMISVTNVSPSSEVYGQDSQITITAVLSWTGTGPSPTASDVSIGGTGPSGYSATSCGAPSGDSLTCTATYTPTGADTVGTYTESASFSGDSNYSGSSSTQTNNFSITQASSSTSVMSNLNPSTVGQQVTFTATIDGQYGLVVRSTGALLSGGVTRRGLIQKGQAHPPVPGGLTGTVTWSANTGCSPSTVSGDPGTAQCTTTTLPQGTDTITATYSGDTNHSGGMGTLSGGQQVNAQTAPAVTLNPTSWNFGTLYLLQSKSKNITVTNTGNATLNITHVSLALGAGTPTGEFSFLNLCPSHLAAGSSCHITASFQANHVGSPAATLNISDNAAGSPQQVPLSATVINPLASYNPASLHFLSVQVGHSSTKDVTLTNTGTTALDITSVSVTGTDMGDFAADSSACPSSLASHAHCTISVTFTPSATGPRSASLKVVDNVFINTQYVPLSGDGTH